MDENNKNTDRKTANKKRSKKLTYLKYLNMELSKKIDHYLKNNQTDPETKALAEKLSANLQKCSHHSLYAFSGNEIELISSITCNHKICNICNWARQKKIRRKYYKWFEDNQTLVELSKNDKIKVTTKSQVDKYLKKGYEIDQYVEYDLMHLTLTVPHTVDGWKNKKFYFDEIKTAFNYMRKSDEWSQFVYGGEYGVESTKNNNGFHIHIHALLFVKQEFRSRNNLHKNIFKLWNHLTAWDGSERKEFKKEHIEGIKAGNELFDDEFIKLLDPTGTTIMNLETIYTLDENNEKVRTRDFNSEAMLIAVMETISYHFAPKMFALTESYTDIENIIEILPAVYRQTLYYKFGCLHGEKSLNVKDDSLLEDYEETAPFDEETGEVYERQFFITNPANMFHDTNTGRIKVKKNKERFLTNIPAKSGREAVKILQNIAYQN